MPGFAHRPIGLATLVKSVGTVETGRLETGKSGSSDTSKSAEPDTGDPAASFPKGVILHVHGYNDYFFQDHFAHAMEQAGYLFYAVDLRAAGRSLAASQIPHYVTDFHEPASDLAAAAQTVREMHPDLPLIVHAHSTGGLTAVLWAHAYRHETGVKAPPDGIVLNAPFFEVPGTIFKRAGAWAAAPVGRLRPTTALASGPSLYATAMLAENGGRWSFDPALKKPDGQPIRLGWLRAVRAAQSRVDQGLDVQGQVLLAASTASSHNAPVLLDSTDTVLDVSAIVSRAEKIGNNVTVLQIPGAVHDLTLSDDIPRNMYFTKLVEWLNKCLKPPKGTSHSQPTAPTPSP
jgi:alpha-beta hydrolase superfamily lysophospholipase